MRHSTAVTTTNNGTETMHHEQQAGLRAPRANTIGVLLGFLPLTQAVRLLDQEHILDLPPRPQLYELHDDVAEYSEQVAAPEARAGAPTTIALLGEEIEDAILQSPTFIREYAPEASYRVCLVPVHLLITPQWYINLSFVEQLRQRAPRLDDLEGALAFAFTEGVELDDFWCSNGAMMVSTSSIGQPRVNQVEGRRISAHEVEVVVRVHSRPNYLEVAKIGSRLVIVNGIHRAAALMQAGFDRIPCLLTQVDGLFDIIPPGALGMVPEPRLMRHERPPYIADYFDAQAAPRFQQRTTYVIAKITPQLEILQVQERDAGDAGA